MTRNEALEDLVTDLVFLARRHLTTPEVCAALQVVGFDESETRHAVEHALEIGLLAYCSRLHLITHEGARECAEPPRCACGRALP